MPALLSIAQAVAQRRIAQTATRVDTAANLAGITLAAGQVAQESDTGLQKVGPGLYNALPYMPRRWSADATNLLAATNGDGVEKTVGSFVIPANTLAVDGDVINVLLRGLYLNNTGSNQSPQFGLGLNSDANWFMGAASTQTIGSINATRLVTADIRVVRTSATTVDVSVILFMAATGNAMTNFGTAYGTWDWVGFGPRSVVGLGVAFNCANQNTINLKAILAAHGTPTLHQITGIAGRGVLLT